MQTKRYKNIDETLVTETLPNGLSINIIPRPEYSKCYAMFATDYGGADRRFKYAGQWIDTPAGVAHFLEHKMFDMPYGNTLNLLSANGASPNAFTSSGVTAYYFESTELFYENLKILLEFVSTPYFTAESVQKEQGIIGQEIRMIEDSPGYALYINLIRCLYEQNPVRDSVAGTAESISQITDETLNKCHKVFYNPSNMTLAVIGDVDPEKVIQIAREMLPAEPGERPERDYGIESSDLPNRSEITVAMEVSAPQFLFGAAVRPAEKGLARQRQQLTGYLALQLIFGRSSPLYTQLYAESLLNSSFEYDLDYTAGTAMAMVGGESREVPAVIERVHEYISGLIENGIDPGYFEQVKRALYGARLCMISSFSALSRMLVSGAFDDYSPLDDFELLEEISLSDVAKFISEHFTREKTALSVINPAS